MGNVNARSIAAPPEDLEEEAHEEDAGRRAFESNLSVRTGPIIESIAPGVETRSILLDSPREVAGCNLEINREVVTLILENRTNVWKTRELGDLIEEFFENSFRNMDLVFVMENFLKHARHRQTQVLCALQQLDDREAEAGGDNRYARTLEELTKFKAAGDPFIEKFFALSQSAYSNQISLLVRLESSKDRLDKNIRSYHGWKKVTKLTFSATTAVVQVCSVVADRMGSPPVAAALEATVATVARRETRGVLTDRIMKSYRKASRGQSDAFRAMETGLRSVMCDLDGVRGSVDRLESEIEEAARDTGFEDREGAMQTRVNVVKENLDGFRQRVDELGTRAECFARDIKRARTMVLQMIIQIPDRR